MTELTQKRVLICDDDRTHIMLMRETLEQSNYQVFEARNGEQAIESFTQNRPDIILLDVNMPKLSGFEVCKFVRQSKERGDVPILMITGSDDHSSIEMAYSVGATDFLPKPIKWPMVNHRVRYMLRTFDTQQELKRSEKELQFLAYYDPLTKLPNRQYVSKILSIFISSLERTKKNLAVMFIDLDNFKRINDTLGHQHGDKVLQEIGARLRSNIRDSDLVSRDFENQEIEVARLGGDEYILILNDCGDEFSVANIANRIIKELSSPISIQQYSVVVTPSIGISVYPKDGEDAPSLIKNADSAKYEAKEKGKSCFKMYSDDFNQRSLDRLALEEFMRYALDADLFEVYYQAQYDTMHNTVNHAEALLRLKHPERGFISPADFIPVAEDTGLIIDIGKWVLNSVCEQLKKWEASQTYNVKVAINVSSKQVSHPNFVKDFSSIIIDSGVNASNIEVELTESIIMHNTDENIEKLNAIKNLGVQLSIDDFGTGYSSLSYLKLFPIDTLKIDKSFINEFKNDNDKIIVSAIAALASAMNLNIVVEGVETHEQFTIVKALCDHKPILIQGYYFAKPLPSAQFIEYKNNTNAHKLQNPI